MLRIGVTGGIGSGKTTVCKFFELLDVPVYYADDRAKWLIQNKSSLKKEIINAYGQEVYADSGELNRAHLAGIVFQDKAALTRLNQLVHPEVIRDGFEWMAQYEGKKPYVLKEAALLYESGSYKKMDYNILVAAPEQLRIERVMWRDNTTPEAVRARIDKQMPEDQKRAMSDFVIDNDGQHLLIPQVWALHHIFVDLA